ncbi:MAG: hypothetical protein HYV45_03100 [Candidatus Moranbacteria bacterium]|nr:hypothetical protein [Candidatus Moranbacteria bacterium]
MRLRDMVKISSIPVLVASLCCLSPIILVLLGVSTVGFAASLADTFYGEYRWYFRGAGMFTLVVALIMYFRKKDICTLDQVRRRRNEIINIAALTFIIGVLGYFFFLYVVVHFIGVGLMIWE